jgi:NADH:ubiquinone oxidoreductase subunit H
MDIQAVVGIFLLIDLYFGWTKMSHPILSILIFVIECLILVLIMSGISAVFARLRIDQLAGLGWQILVPLALLQIGFIILMGV